MKTTFMVTFLFLLSGAVYSNATCENMSENISKVIEGKYYALSFVKLMRLKLKLPGEGPLELEDEQDSNFVMNAMNLFNRKTQKNFELAAIAKNYFKTDQVVPAKYYFLVGELEAAQTTALERYVADAQDQVVAKKEVDDLSPACKLMVGSLYYTKKQIDEMLDYLSNNKTALQFIRLR